MKTVCVDNIDSLRSILETSGDEPLKICLENNTYRLQETISVKRNNFTLDAGGATIKGSKRIDFSSAQKLGDLVVIDLSAHNIPLRNYHNLRFPWCIRIPEELPNERDAFGTPVPKGPECGGVYGIDNTGPDIEVFYNDKALSVTRYPENGYMEIEKTLSEYPEGHEDQIHMNEGGPDGVFVPADTNFTKMEKADEALLFGYWSWDWSPHHHTIKSIDSENNIISVDKPYDNWGYLDARGEDKLCGKFYAINVFGTLDKPGQWFVDRSEKKLYVYPYPGQDYVEISVCGTLFKGNNISGASFENLNLQHGQSCGFYFENSSDISISDVCMENLSEWGVVACNCNAVNVADCKIRNTGGGGIYLSGGERVNLVSSENKVLNCEISSIANWYLTYSSAVEIRGVGAVVSGCKLYNLPHFAIIFSGNNHTVENNEIFDVCRFSNDSGAVYSGRNYTFYGNVIRNNYFHNIYGMDGCGCSCLYFDDCMSSAEIYGNIFANVAYAIQIGGGHDFRIHHNSFFNCDLFFVDNRGRDGFWMHDAAIEMRNFLKKSPYQNDAWKNAYPELYNANIDCDEFFYPYNNSFTDNLFVRCGDFYVEDQDIGKWLKMENNTFIKRDKTKIYDESNACHNLRHIFKSYSVLKAD